MSIIEQARKLQRAQALAQAEFFEQQNAKQMRMATSESVDVFYEQYLPSRRSDRLVTQTPVRAIVRETGIRPHDGVVLNPHHMAETAPKFTPEPVTGSPVNLTVGEISRMSPEDRAIAIRKIMAFDGAKARMEPIPGRTLTQALERELDHQRSVIRRASELARQGETDRISKSAAKRDRSKGMKKKVAGKAAFRGLPTNVVETMNGNPISAPGKSWLDPTMGDRVETKRVRGELTQLQINKLREKK